MAAVAAGKAGRERDDGRKKEHKQKERSKISGDRWQDGRSSVDLMMDSVCVCVSPSHLLAPAACSTCDY